MKRAIAPIVLGIAGIATLLILGTWQMQRLEWKRAILDEIDATIAGDPQPLPTMIDPVAQRYQPVALTGQIGDDALFVLVSVKLRGAGWRVISPFETEDGRRILLDRGYIPVDDKSAPARPDPVTVQGNLLWPDDRTSSTPENDETGNIWYARDVAPMADMLKTEPLLVIARDVSPPDPGVMPMPVDSSGIPNDHLQYAITWYSLAAVWLLMTALWTRRRLKES